MAKMKNKLFRRFHFLDLNLGSKFSTPIRKEILNAQKLMNNLMTPDRYQANKMRNSLLFFVASLLFSCAAPLPLPISPSASPAPQAATPPPVVVEKIQLQAGSDPLAITELRVEPTQLALQTHEVAKIKVLARLANGQTVEVLNHGKLNWQLADPTQLSLLNGTLKALQPGESDVVIRAGDQETRLKVKIIAPSGGGNSSGATLTQPELILPQPLYRLAVGENVYLQASLKQPDGSESKDLLFSVDKPALFELDSASGRLRRIKAGSATVTVQARLNGDVLKTIALEDKVVESSPSGGGGNSLTSVGIVSTPQPTPFSSTTPVPNSAATSISTPNPQSTATPTPIATPTAPVPTPTSLPVVVNATPLPNQLPIDIPAPLYITGKIGTSMLEIYSISPGINGVLNNLSQNTANDRLPVLSPHKNKILFESNRETASYMNLYTMDISGNNIQKVFNNQPGSGVVSGYQWSPDAAKFLVVAAKDVWGREELYIVNSDGSIETKPIQNLGDDTIGYASWHPSGTSIIFNRLISGNGYSHIYSVNVDGSNLINLSQGIDNKASRPVFSPDGNRILYASQKDGNSEICLVNPDGSNRVNLSQNSAWDDNPEWSPDGSKIVFRSNRGGQSDLYVINSNGTNLNRITNTTTGEGFFGWNGSNTHVYYLATAPSGKSAIYRVNISTSVVEALLEEGIESDAMITWFGSAFRY